MQQAPISSEHLRQEIWAAPKKLNLLLKKLVNIPDILNNFITHR
jgi:hypothetical protein